MLLTTYILYKILAYRIRCKIHAYFINRKSRLREVGLFSIGLHHKPGIQDTSLTPRMAPRPVLKPWDKRPRLHPHLFIYEQSPMIPRQFSG